jgi:hypothetical protein
MSKLDNTNTLLGKEKLLNSEHREASKSPNKKKKVPQMTEEEKAINLKIFKSMNKKLNYLKNPRFNTNNPCLLYSNTLFKDIVSQENPFVVEPKIVIFREYQLGSVYQIDLRLTNRRQLLQAFKYIPPNSDHFTIKSVIYPKKDSSLIAPGMSARIEILFHATSRESVEDDLTIITESFAFKVKLQAVDEKPSLSLENPLECYKCFVGDQVSMLFRCKNNGGNAHFRLHADNMLGEIRENQGEELMYEDETLHIEPFIIFPQEFYLIGDRYVNLEVVFKPDYEGIIERDLFINCDSKFNLKFQLKGEGIMVDLKILSIDDILVDEDIDALETLMFEETFPNIKCERTLKIVNKSSVPIKYHWSVYDVFRTNNFNFEDEPNHFCIEPERGFFQGNEELTFKVSFMPKSTNVYEQKIDLIIEDVPLQAFTKFKENQKSYLNYKESILKDEPYMIALNSPYPMYPIYTFNLKGKGKLCYLEAEDNFIDFGNIYLGQKAEKSFSICNPKSGFVLFKINKNIQIVSKTKKIEKAILSYYEEFPQEGLLKPKKSLGPASQYNKPIELLDNISDNGAEIQAVNYMKLYTSSENMYKDPVPSSVSQSSTFNSKSKLTTRQSLTQRYAKSLKSNKTSEKSLYEVKIPGNTVYSNIEVNDSTLLKLHTEGRIRFNSEIVPNNLGNFKGVINISPFDGVPLSIDFRANVVGPKVVPDSPSINFGLFPIGQIQTKKMKLKNLSPITARFLIKESRYKNIDFSNYLEYDYVKKCEGVITKEKSKNRIDSLKDLEIDNLDKKDPFIQDAYELKFSQISDYLQPHEEKEIIVTFVSPYPKLFQDEIEILIENGENQFTTLFADCQQAFAYIDEPIIKPETIFVTVPIKHGDNGFNLVNPSNLPISFKWNNRIETEVVKTKFTPEQGIIPPRSYTRITYQATYYTLLPIDDLYICDIPEIDVPLGVVIQGKVSGLDINYEFTDETFLNILKAKSEVEAEEFVEYLKEQKRHNNRTHEENSHFNKRINAIELRDLKINRPYYLSFEIENSSGIATQFKFSSKNYQAYIAENPVNTTITNNSMTNTVNTTGTRKNRSLQSTGLNHDLLTAKHEEMHFTSEKGLEFNKMKQIERDSTFFLQNKKGVAIVINPSSGKLKPNSKVTINIEIYNEVIGDFTDELICEVKSLPTREIPIYLRIRGNPLQIYPFQPGIEYTAFPPLVKMGSILTRVGFIEKNLKLYNIGNNFLNLLWKIYDYNDILYPNRDIFNIRLNEQKGVFNSNFNIEYIATEPAEITDNLHFNINPIRSVINPKGTFDYKIGFSTDKPGKQTVMMVAYPSYSDGGSHSKLTELAIKVDAHGVSPCLEVDKSVNLF